MVQAAIESLEVQGYTVVTTAHGDFHGDGLREVAASIADPAIRDEREEFLRRSAAGCARAARVVILKPDKLELKLWTELPLSGGTGDAAAICDTLATADLVEDNRPELFVGTYQPLMGNTGEGDAYVYTYRGGGFQEIWRIEGESWRWARVAHCEVARSCPGRELAVAHAPDDPYHMWRTAQHFPLSTYGYRGGKYEFLSRRLTIGRYHSADEALAHLPRWCRLP